MTPHLINTNLLSGLTVALAMVPEAIAFALIAHVSPLTGLYAAVLGTGGTMADIEAWPEQIAAVRPADVVAAARKEFADRKTPWTEAELKNFGSGTPAPAAPVPAAVAPAAPPSAS